MPMLILDTDIGTDVDDCLALGVLLGSPEIDLLGITCVYGDVALRGRMVAELLRLAGRPDVSIHLGAQDPLLGLQPIYWAGHEGGGLLNDAPPTSAVSNEHAVDFLIRTVMESPGEIHLLAVGPLTNVALAVRREPDFARNLGHLTVMAGAVRGFDGLHLPVAEHNVRCDPEAAHVVLSAGAPITLVPLDVTTQVRIDQSGVARLHAVGDPLRDAIADQVERYPRFSAQGWTYLHDPLAAALATEPTLAQFADLHVGIEIQGRLTTGATVATAPTAEAPANARVALKVDAPAAEQFVLERLTTSLNRL